MEKYCPRCDRHLPLSSFGRRLSAPDGWQYTCAECRHKRPTGNTYDIVQDIFDGTQRWDCQPHIHADRALIFGDAHVPTTHIAFASYMLNMAEKQGLEQCVVAGDFLNETMFSVFKSQDKNDWQEEIGAARSFLQALFRPFQNVLLLAGNHDRRILKQLDYFLTMENLYDMVVRDNKLSVSNYSSCYLNDDWYVFHPNNYSRVPGSVGRQIAAKEHKHVIVAHHHVSSHTFDVSGKYHVFDIGGLADPAKTEYLHMNVTTHPKWIPGFLTLINGNPQLHTIHEIQ